MRMNKINLKQTWFSISILYLLRKKKVLVMIAEQPQTNIYYPKQNIQPWVDSLLSKQV